MGENNFVVSNITSETAGKVVKKICVTTLVIRVFVDNGRPEVRKEDSW